MKKIKDFMSKNFKIIVPCLIGLILFVGIFVNIRGTLSNEEEKSNRISFTSNSTDFYENEEGSWYFSKYAYLNGPNKLIVQYSLEANSGTLNKDEDVLFVINNSRTAHCSSNIDKEDVELYSTGNIDEDNDCYSFGVDAAMRSASLGLLLRKENSRVAIMSYSDEYQMLTNLTNETEVINTVFDNYDRAVNKYTNYYKALEGINEFLKNYTFSNDRELRIILSVGDVSIGKKSEEEALFKEIKQKYPNVTIYAVHNFIDYDNSKLERIKKISDYIYSYGTNDNLYDNELREKSNTEPIPKVKKLDQLGSFYGSSIFEQLIQDKPFSLLRVVDNYNSEYFNFNDFKIIYNNAGNIEYNKNNNSLTWTIDGEIIKNYLATLIVELSVNNNEKTNKLIPVNNNINVKSKFEGKSEENIDVPATPYVNFYKKVIIDKNANCDYSNIEDEYYYKVGDQVDLSNLKMTCDGYEFEGWNIEHRCGSRKLNNLAAMSQSSKGIINTIVFDAGNSYYCQETPIIDNRFVMPGDDIYIYPKLSKITIDKSINGGRAFLQGGVD